MMENYRICTPEKPFTGNGYELVIWVTGTKLYYLNNKRHRLGGPAIDVCDGSKGFYINGELYNNEVDYNLKVSELEKCSKTNQESMNNIKPDSSTIKTDEEYHQVNAPSKLTNKDYELVIDLNGNKHYYLNGLLHRENAPAVIYTGGHQEWWIHGKLHNLNGPARTRASGEKEYWIDNKEYEENEFTLKVVELNNKKSEEKVIKTQDKENIKPDEIKSATEFIKPYSEYSQINDYDQAWCIHNKRHNINAPAIILADGKKEYWIYGKEYNEAEYKLAMEELNYVVPDSEYRIVNDYTELAGEGYELIIWPNGDRTYYVDGHLHRDHGPARIFANGKKEYWINSEEYNEIEFNLKMVELYVIYESVKNNNSKELDLESLFAKGINPETIELYKKDYAEETNNMNNPEINKPKTLTTMIKNDAQMALYRVATTQITKGIKSTLLQVLERQGSSSEHLKSISELLDSEFGSSLISMILGLALTYAPGLKDDKRVTVLAKEFRINGMAVAGNAVIGVAIENFLPVITNALKSIPEEPAAMIRVANHDEENNLASQELEQNDEAVMKNSL